MTSRRLLVISGAALLLALMGHASARADLGFEKVHAGTIFTSTVTATCSAGKVIYEAISRDSQDDCTTLTDPGVVPFDRRPGCIGNASCTETKVGDGACVLILCADS